MYPIDHEAMKHSLLYAMECGLLDMPKIMQDVEQKKLEACLEQHKYAIWINKKGDYCTYLPDSTKKYKRRLIKRKSRERLLQTVSEFYEEQKSNPTVDEVFEEWIEKKVSHKEISFATHDRYQSDYKRFFQEFGKRRIRDVDEADIEDFILQSIAGHELTVKAYAGLRTLVFGIFRRARRQHLVDYSITDLVNDMDLSPKAFRHRLKEDSEEVFTEGEAPLLLQYCMEHRDILNLGIILLYCTGMRVGELVAVKTDEIHDGIIPVRRTESRFVDENGKKVYRVMEHPKTNAGNRDVIVPGEFLWLFHAIRELNPDGEYLMTKNGQRVRTYTIRKRLHNICQELGITPKSPHKIRKTYASILMDNHVDTSLIIRQMGHTDILCTEKYYYRNRKNAERNVEIFSNVPEFRCGNGEC